ncbi:MAG TPA: sulfite exporter TauE/SafE family protein [Sedimentisphaerales bacterium]|nr:sulfite exporter TauE/SafE family protein [Sedimentisphaerales bacterium]HRS11514.1 sulfite exporter TauE/SafE family protein [Sedimentisphaerales bacterium]HRV48234.1 sulfite exporter TauE/SafE family protein [Sedimentisphaerales bacterium]
MIAAVDRLIDESPAWALFIVFWIGAVASLSSCTAVRLPVVIGYVGGIESSKKRAILLTCLFAAGLVLSYVLLGMLMTTAGGIAGRLLGLNKYFFWLLGALLIVTGLLVSGILNVHLLPEKWHGLGPKLQKATFPGAALLGFLFGLLLVPGCPSCGAGLLILAGIVVAKKLSAYGLLLFLSFALGQSVPVLAVGVLTALMKPDVIDRARTRICSLERRVQLVAGNALMIVGIYLTVVG